MGTGNPLLTALGDFRTSWSASLPVKAGEAVPIEPESLSSPPDSCSASENLIPEKMVRAGDTAGVADGLALTGRIWILRRLLGDDFNEPATSSKTVADGRLSSHL